MRRGGRDRPPAPAPFVVGVGRSGTTLLRMMLDAHPELAIPAETHFVPELIARAEAGTETAQLIGDVIGSRAWDDFGIEPEQLRARAQALSDGGVAGVLRAFYELCAEREGKPRWGDKTPVYVAHMRTIGAVLAEARFVHLIRDGRDVALSRRNRGMGAGKPIADAARLWRRRIEAGRKQARRLRGRYLELRYEDLVAAPETELRRVCALIELEFEPAMLDYHRTSGARLAELSDLDPAGTRPGRSGEERRRAHALATGPPEPGRAGGWREGMGEADLVQFEAEAGALLAELGYDVAS